MSDVPVNVDGQRFLDLREAARLLGLKPKTLRNWAAARRVRAYLQMVPRRLLFRREDLEGLRVPQPLPPHPKEYARRAQAQNRTRRSARRRASRSSRE